MTNHNAQRTEMADSRRDFFRKAGNLTLGAATASLWASDSLQKVHAATERLGQASPEAAALDEQFWYSVRGAFNLSPQFINFENGYFSPQPEAGIDEVCKNARAINEIPSFYMRRKLVEDTREIHQLLAHFAGCSDEEILLTRNTTESLNIVIMGLKLQPGDEALWGTYEYGSMKVAFEQRAAREGIVNKVLDLPITSMSNDEIVAAYKKAITPRTKVILVSHIVYLTGQVLPVRAICDMAHEQGVEVIVDGAHAFAHLADKIPDLHCDYYGASLHKWMLAPLGTGILYIKKENIDKVWPLFGDGGYASDSIHKFAHIGTYPAYLQLALAEAIRFNQTIGLERKEARLRYIKNYWVNRLINVPNIVVHTPREAHRSCAISTVGIKGQDPADVTNALYDKYKIFTVPPGYPGAVRICPNIYTIPYELDAFVAAMKELAAA